MASPTPTIHLTEHVNRIGMVARWQPVHRGHVPVLRALCDRASQALIGIGSSNRHDLRNPFTLEERIDMVRLALPGRANYSLLPVPDLDDGPRWREMVVDLFGTLDLFVTDSPYVTSLLAADYKTIKPVGLVPKDERVAVNGSMVRKEMARGDGWWALVPEEIADYITAGHLDERFRRELWNCTLTMINAWSPDTSQGVSSSQMMNSMPTRPSRQPDPGLWPFRATLPCSSTSIAPQSKRSP